MPNFCAYYPHARVREQKLVRSENTCASHKKKKKKNANNMSSGMSAQQDSSVWMARFDRNLSATYNSPCDATQTDLNRISRF